MTDYNDIIDFWFKEATPKDWFRKSDEFDQKIRGRFLDVHRQAAQGKLREWEATPEGALAEVIVLDQFSRNMFRGSPEAFAQDALALEIAQDSIARGDDKKLPSRQRHFLYMPYMHSESKEAHEEALKLFESLGEKGALKYEVEHKDIIDRFGRYPHRNEIICRASTSEEIEFIKTHKGF